METKQEKFVRLSSQRLEKALFGMKQLTHLTSHHYEFSNDQVKELISQLRAGVANVAEAFGLTEDEERKPEPAPIPEPANVPDAPRFMADGELELNQEETLHLIRVGPQIGAAIDAIDDKKPEEAKDLLLNLMRS